MSHSSTIACIILCILLAFQDATCAEEATLDVAKVLAVVPVKKGTVGNDVYRQFDRLVPELKKISKNKIIKLECRYSGRPDREQDVVNAYKLAGRIEKYLRERHKLDLDLWIAIEMNQKSAKSSPVLTIAVFPDSIKNLDSVLVDASKNNRQ